MANEIVRFPPGSSSMHANFIGGSVYAGEFGVGYSYLSGRYIRGGIRFENIDIEKNATNINADLHMYAYSRTGSSDIYVKAWGIDEDNTGPGDPFGRPKTTASNTHHQNVSQGSYFSIGVGGLIEEIVARSGWVKGNAIGFIVEDNGTSTASPGNFLYDYTGGDETFLHWRVGSEPNFKPTPKSVSAPTFPAVDSYGIKISYPGYDVMDATEDQTYFTTRKRCFRVILQGKITTTANTVYNIAHGKSYKPFARAYFKSTSSGKRFKIPRFMPGFNIQDPDGDYTDGRIEVDGTNVKILTTDACEVYYYIYVDELAT